jgi:hypothetical protein
LRGALGIAERRLGAVVRARSRADVDAIHRFAVDELAARVVPRP